jgi:hypothetical protein
LYDPYSLDFQNLDGKKFLQNVNSISWYNIRKRTLCIEYIL